MIGTTFTAYARAGATNLVAWHGEGAGSRGATETTVFPARGGAGAVTQPSATGGVDSRRARVVLAEDHSAVAAQLLRILGEEFEVVSCVADGEALVAAARELRPEVIVADISMPKRDGMAAAAEILRARLGCRVVFVSVHADAELVRRGLSMGASGYVLKLMAGEDLVFAVREALRGRRYVSPILGIDAGERGLQGDER